MKSITRAIIVLILTYIAIIHADGATIPPRASKAKPAAGKQPTKAGNNPLATSNNPRPPAPPPGGSAQPPAQPPATPNPPSASGVAACDCKDPAGLGASYTQSDVQVAVNEGIKLKAAGTQVGRQKYPHQFNNREALTFPHSCSGAFIEFPIIGSQAFTGGSPGADRVVFTSSGAFCGCMTHNGASQRNGFRVCT